MKLKLKNGGTIKLQSAWTNIPSINDSILRAWENQRNIEIAKEKATEQVQKEKPTHTYVNPYDYTRGWREATEDAAKQDAYMVKNLGGTDEQAKEAYDNVWTNARKQLTRTTATGLGTVGLMGISGGALGIIPAIAVNTGFAIPAARRFISDNGVKKTINLTKEGKYPEAILSGMGDILDLSLIGNVPKLGTYLSEKIPVKFDERSFTFLKNPALEEAILTSNYTPMRYELLANKIGQAARKFMTPKPRTNGALSEMNSGSNYLDSGSESLVYDLGNIVEKRHLKTFDTKANDVSIKYNFSNSAKEANKIAKAIEKETNTGIYKMPGRAVEPIENEFGEYIPRTVQHKVTMANDVDPSTINIPKLTRFLMNTQERYSDPHFKNIGFDAKGNPWLIDGTKIMKNQAKNSILRGAFIPREDLATIRGIGPQWMPTSSEISADIAALKAARSGPQFIVPEVERPKIEPMQFDLKQLQEALGIKLFE